LLFASAFISADTVDASYASGDGRLAQMIRCGKS